MKRGLLTALWPWRPLALPLSPPEAEPTAVSADRPRSASHRAEALLLTELLPAGPLSLGVRPPGRARLLGLGAGSSLPRDLGPGEH